MMYSGLVFPSELGRRECRPPFSCDSVGDALVIWAGARWQVAGLADNAASGHELPGLHSGKEFFQTRDQREPIDGSNHVILRHVEK